VKERPILFSAQMVLAILAGRKTQTRRIMKLPLKDPDFGCELSGSETTIESAQRLCPYGKPGDQLWVKEALQASDGDGSPIQYQADGYIDFGSNWVWKRLRLPSMFCPRGMSRIKLEITSVRVQKLQDISERDCCAEGMGSPITRDCKKPKFQALWDSINGNWNENPWVWVVEFKTLTPQGGGKHDVER
jgi:hypothetical protein